ncbi:hypothetical protein [Thermoactinomyces mirandus]|uniref:Uncharacterized protein n=1 Tax=Thermoactinomyces mirandus TaxID=2756294 RepID=A0A7W2ASN5_9BACL|nr:hypothetical protein [Thermoactinomyces mirandus]MBA4602661.1 hypothetical protein [Thermoactinomyces mirandus]
MHFMLEQINRSKFREDLDLEKAVSFIYLSLKTLTRQWLDRVTKQQPENALNRWKEMLNEYREMLDIFKNGVYQRGKK